MPWNGGGVFTRDNGFQTGPSVWQLDKAGGIKIVSDRHDTHDQDLAAGINACLAKNGENVATGNLNLGAFRITNAGNAVADGDLATLGQVKGTLGAPSGTKLLFPGTAAVPAGWSIDTTGAYDDAAIRIRTTGSTGTGGDQGFTTAFASGRSSAGYTLQTADIPAHLHTGSVSIIDPTHSHGISPQAATMSGSSNVIGGNGVGPGAASTQGAATGITATTSINNAGGGGSHAHVLASFAVKYVDSVVGIKS